MYGVNVKITGTGSFCPFGKKTVAFSVTPSRIGIFTPQRMFGTGSAEAPPSCATLAPARTLTQSAAKRIIRCMVLLDLISHCLRRNTGHFLRTGSFEHTNGIALEREFLQAETNVSALKSCSAAWPYDGAFAGAAATRFRILSRRTFLWFASSTSNR